MLTRRDLLALAACLALPDAGFARPGSESRIPLSSLDAGTLSALGAVALDDLTTGRVPNYLQALASTHPASVLPFARLVRTMIFGGTISPAIKVAMGQNISRNLGSVYLTAHLSRLAGALPETPESKAETHSLQKQRAVRYGDALTAAIHGVTPAQFAETRAVFNDARIVELTMVTCFFNYFARFCQALALPPEGWLAQPPGSLPAVNGTADDLPRVTLASDAELETASRLLNPSPELKKGLGIGIANSQRAMIRVPDLAAAWWDYWQSVRTGAQVPRTTLLQVSFAVSMANGCRYCVLHQVAGLRRQGVDIAKLQAMQKDDSALTTEEKAAVVFARTLTKSPQNVYDSDFAALKAAFPDNRATQDIVLQTCAFAFMNRFTDGLRLPSEDEAVHVYQEVYGNGAYRAFPRPH